MCYLAVSVTMNAAPIRPLYLQDGKTMMKRALVLTGGGARGAYQVGMLRELVVNQHLDFHIIRGVSVGALNAAFLAQAPTTGDSQAALVKQVHELQELWLSEIKGNHSVYADRLGLLGLAAGTDSLYSLQPLRQLIDKRLHVEALRTSGRNFTVGTVSLVTGRYEEWPPSDEHFVDKLIASSAIPVVFPFVDFKEDKEVLVDGGVRNITPLGSVFREEPDEIYILLASQVIREDTEDLPSSAVRQDTYQKWDDNWLGTKVSGLDVLKRTLDILSDEIYLDDIRSALRWNEVIEHIEKVETTVAATANLPAAIVQAVHELATSRTRQQRRYVKIYVLAPREWFGSDNSATNFDPDLIKKAIDHGREVASKPELWLWPPPEADIA